MKEKRNGGSRGMGEVQMKRKKYRKTCTKKNKDGKKRKRKRRGDRIK